MGKETNSGVTMMTLNDLEFTLCSRHDADLEWPSTHAVSTSQSWLIIITFCFTFPPHLFSVGRRPVPLGHVTASYTVMLTGNEMEPEIQHNTQELKVIRPNRHHRTTTPVCSPGQPSVSSLLSTTSIAS